VSPCLLPELALVRAIHYRPSEDTSSPPTYLTADMIIAPSQGELPPLLLKKRSDLVATVLGDERLELVSDRAQDPSSRLMQRLIYDSVATS
jgi:hypothetical protein